ncbi:MAG: hypothetical protein JF570_11725, partial [Caulobacter sp.]|nr:hypothetical protein [Caulobacter sp.]
VSHMGEIETTGPDAQAFLQRILSNDVAKIADDGAQYSVLTKRHGLPCEPLARVVLAVAVRQALLKGPHVHPDPRPDRRRIPGADPPGHDPVGGRGGRADRDQGRGLAGRTFGGHAGVAGR